ncbi:unnamed protein product [Closterium sp. NIES-65]|nr:unnamed protein product [Closterium sp. NIES-65]
MASDLVVTIGQRAFHVHQYPLLSLSTVIASEAAAAGEGTGPLQAGLSFLPGGALSLEMGGMRQWGDAAVGGAVGDGAVGDGAVGDGAVGDGAVGDGAVGDGAVGDGAVGDGAVGDGAVGDGEPGVQEMTFFLLLHTRSPSSIPHPSHPPSLFSPRPSHPSLFPPPTLFSPHTPLPPSPPPPLAASPPRRLSPSLPPPGSIAARDEHVWAQPLAAAAASGLPAPAAPPAALAALLCPVLAST